MKKRISIIFTALFLAMFTLTACASGHGSKKRHMRMKPSVSVKLKDATVHIIVVPHNKGKKGGIVAKHRDFPVKTSMIKSMKNLTVIEYTGSSCIAFYLDNVLHEYCW